MKYSNSRKTDLKKLSQAYLEENTPTCNFFFQIKAFLQSG